MKRSLLALALLATAVPAVGQQPTRVERENFFNTQQAFVSVERPTFGVSRTINVGEALYTNTRFTAVTQVMVEEDRTIETPNGTVSVAQGQILRGHLDEYVDLSSWFVTQEKSFVRGGKAKSKAMFRDTDGNGSIDTVETANGFAKVFKIIPPIPYHFVAYAANPDFVWSLTYLGTAGGVLRIAYREFSQGMARPAFANELSFPAEVGKRNVVRFKDLQLSLQPNSDGSAIVEVARGTANK